MTENHTDTDIDEEVLISSSWKSDSRSYHTTDCRRADAIRNEKRLPRSEAEAMGLSECAFCSGAYEVENGDHDLYEKLVQMGEANAD